MRQVITVATAMGIVGVVGSFGMLLLAMDWLHLDVAHIQTYVFLKMAVAGHLVLFVARSRDYFWKQPWPAPILVWSAIITKLAAPCWLLLDLGSSRLSAGQKLALYGGYSIASALLTDVVKVQIYHHMQHRTAKQKNFLSRIQESLHDFKQ